ncbi:MULTISPECIES: cyclic nucleotide-binding/CBS domain-containing protein [Salinibaculum]|uniref:CBS domain-containing protein n=1 Tax=Salinibaculum TaxID=2732368 RepID=UPI0030D23A75
MIEQSVGDVMTRSVHTITGEMTACDVAVLFAEHEIGSAVVVAPETDEVIGIVTESDIMQQVAAGADIESIRVESFLSAPVITIASSESIHTAADKMRTQSIRRLPVVDNGDLVGIITTTNLTHYLPRLRNTILRGRKEFSGQ